ncbi:MAG: metalloregulator ArsR/SmtB family transcription factor [Rhodothermia bacterium]|nr:MAG: metalloregulator ArsR/SmtB family transcription factor [Rhodothermia bacterium]
MAYPRSEEFIERQKDLAESARALGHPGRLAILEVLAHRNTCNCGELVDELPLAQATVSQHLKVLKSAGLIQGTIEGPRTCYCIDWDAVVRVRDAFEEWFSEIGDAAQCCQEVQP